MKCPECGRNTLVVITTPTAQGTRRRRKCSKDHYFTTLELYVGRVGTGYLMPVVTVAKPEKAGGRRTKGKL